MKDFCFREIITYWDIISSYEIELWRPILYRDIKSNLYEVSNYGNVRNIKTGYIKSQRQNDSGYLYVGLVNTSNKVVSCEVHRLVATAFVEGHTKERDIVNHKDGKKLNNKSNNLEWVTASENAIHAINNGFKKIVIGEQCGSTIITENVAVEICELLVKYNGSSYDVCQYLNNRNINVSYGIIYAIKNKDSWCHISDNYFKPHEFDRFHWLELEDVKLICETLLKHCGSVKCVFNELNNVIPDISIQKISRIKYKKRWADVSDKYFDTSTFVEMKTRNIELICRSLVKYHGDSKNVLEELKDTIPNLSLRKIEHIKSKETCPEISDKYFRKNEFSRRIH